ncbi:PTSINtr with GAF domain, PtsP [Psychromonas ingrahamii 37]|uniref:phosphoenolpyruvate--protein phosphotransferase n=1 Tax=Psychromonas ingrahamii (strain DSM 17664 / CCUG 51855 / 37) TaxID=357804 RepID=A1SS93_PSYIN|nr:phosphoenolpyruvate--protein phosphotransferase [Psychromonas ingrahamii]ABM02358.1 PTSINtr with GAF domain, PtsP [Psychromonas ingrahamii 37]
MLSQLRNIVEQVGNAKNLTEAMDILVRQTKLAMEVDCCSIYITDQSTSQLNLIASEGLASQVVGFSYLKFGEGIIGLIHQKGEPLNIANITEHPNYKYLPSSGEESFNSLLGTPIIHRRKALGVLVVQQKEPRLFSELEESFLLTLAMHLASVLDQPFSLDVERLNQPRASIYLQGSPASPGIAIADAYVVRSIMTLAEVIIGKSHSVVKELLLFEIIVKKCIDEFSNLALTLKEQVSKDAFILFDIYSHILKDKTFLNAIRSQINESHLNAPSAVKVVAESYIKQFEAMSDPYLSQRSSDIRDVAQRLLYHLTHQVEDDLKLPDKLILVANEVTLSMVASIPNDKLQGIVSVHGGIGSHVAILARTLGIPAVMGVQFSLDNINQKSLIIDGYEGGVILLPEQSLVSHYQSVLDEENELKKLVESDPHEKAVTLDGHAISILLNTGLNAKQHGTILGHFDGIGLYRSELPFILTDSFPTEQEQVQVYQRLLDQYPKLPVTMRTLDIGGDKSLSYFPIVEDNPFLGWRGIRLTLDHPEIFLVQIRAMLRASVKHQNLRIMLPMVTSIEEVDEAHKLITQAWNEIKFELNYSSEAFPMPAIGAMVEVPAAVFLIPALAKKVDFVSVGSNDLIQYLLAVDRNNSRVASLYDSYHPAVLQALKMIIDNSKRFDLEVSICGELASDPIGALILIGLGYTKLSMNSYNMGRIKYLINALPRYELESCVEQALKANKGTDIRAIFVDYLNIKELGGFIRAGNSKKNN